MNEDVILFGVPVVAFVATLFVTFRLGKTKNGAGLIGCGLVWLTFTVFMFFGMQNASGWDGLSYLLGLILLGAPSGLAALIGGFWGWAKSEKAMNV